MVCLVGIRDISENANDIFVFFLFVYIFCYLTVTIIFIYLNNIDTRTTTSMISSWYLVFNFEYISHHFLMFLLFTLLKFIYLKTPENLALFCSVHNNPYCENSRIPFVPRHSTFIIFC